MNYKIIIGELLDEEQKSQIVDLIQTTFSEIDAVFNKWNPYSEISSFNQLKAYKKHQLSPLLKQLLLHVDQIVHLSKGRFDPTIEPLQELWKRKLSQGVIPAQQEIEAIAPSIGWKLIHLNEDVVFKEHDQTKLDLGGIAKGFAIDLLIERLSNLGYQHIYVEWGGEIRTKGRHPHHRPWTIFISRLGNHDPQMAIATLSLEDQAIATSGDYLQNWLIQPGITYFHIFDPHTLQPLKASCNTIASASVVAPTCALADGLATAAMLFVNEEEARIWCTEMKTLFPEISFWLVSRESLPLILSETSN